MTTFERGERVLHIPHAHNPYSGKTGRVLHFDGDPGFQTGRGRKQVWVAYDDPSTDPREKWTDVSLLVHTPLPDEVVALMDALEAIPIGRETDRARNEIVLKLDAYGIWRDDQDCWRNAHDQDRIVGRFVVPDAPSSH